MNLCFFSDARNLHVQRLANGLARRGHAVHVVSHKTADIEAVRVERFRVPNAGLTMPFRWHSRWQRYLRGFVHRFDVVVWYFLQDFGFTPEIIESGCFVATPRGSDIVPPPGETPPSVEWAAQRRELLRHATLVGAAGPQFAAVVAESAGLDGKKIERLPLGVDLQEFRPADVRSPSASRSPRIGFFKGFRPVYGALDLVAAIPLILRRRPDIQFELVGEGPTLTQCKTLALELGVGGAVRWLPRRPHHQMPDLLRHWDLTVMPSICESFGLAALESAAMRVPVVASDICGFRDTVVHERSGLLVPAKSPEVLADSVVALLDDQPRRQRFGTFGRAWVAENFDWQRVLTQWENVLAKACDHVHAVA